MAHELYKKHRPLMFKHMFGQESIVNQIKGFLEKGEFPHSTLFVGPSGTGKTTIARILKKKLGCSDIDYQEIDCASSGSIEMVREMQAGTHTSPLDGPCKIWLLDECQSLSRAGFAMQALLKILEDTPKHCYFFLCTTDKTKLLPTILTRCTVFPFQSLKPKDIKATINYILEKEQKTIPDSVLEKLVEVSDGSARKSLVLLGQIFEVEGDSEQLNILQNQEEENKAIDIARKLMDKNCKWKDLAPIVKSVDEDAEQIRRLILGYASSIALSCGPLTGRAYFLLNVFSDTFFNTGKPGLVRSCFEVCASKEGY